MVDACDQHLREIANAQRFANWGKNNEKMIEGPREQRPTYDELKAKHGPNWGITA